MISGLQIDVEWADVPRGQDTGRGMLNLSIQNNGTGNIHFVKVSGAGDFGTHLWTPCAPLEGQVAEYIRTYGGDVRQYADILTVDAGDDLADLKQTVSTTLNTADAGSPEFRAALGHSNAIRDRQLAGLLT